MPIELAGLSDEVTLTSFDPGNGFSLFVHRVSHSLAGDARALETWLADSHAAVDALVLDSSAVVLRRFPVNDAEALDRVAEMLGTAGFDSADAARRRRRQGFRGDAPPGAPQFLLPDACGIGQRDPYCRLAPLHPRTAGRFPGGA